MKKQNNVVDSFLDKPKKKSRKSNKPNNSSVVRVSLASQKASNKMNEQVFNTSQKKADTDYKRLINDIQTQLSFGEKLAEKALHSKLGSVTNLLLNDVIFNNSFWATTLYINFLLVSLAFILSLYCDVKITTSIVFVALISSGLVSLLVNVIRKRN